METVKSCVEFKKWQDKPVYKVELSNGNTGESFQFIPPGTPVTDLEITPNGNYADKIKLKKQGFAGGAPKKVNNAAFAMSYAKDLVVADKIKFDQLIPAADKIYNWIESKK